MLRRPGARTLILLLSVTALNIAVRRSAFSISVSVRCSRFR
jgi:hypothetical protein